MFFVKKDFPHLNCLYAIKSNDAGDLKQKKLDRKDHEGNTSREPETGRGGPREACNTISKLCYVCLILKKSFLVGGFNPSEKY